MALNSWLFLVFAAAAVLMMRLTPSLLLRKAMLLVFSVVFIGTYLTTGRALFVLAIILVAIYALGHPRVRAVVGWQGQMTGVTVAVLWALLFLIKDPSTFRVINPFSAVPIAIVGISYLVFRGISYLMESESAPRTTFLDYLNYMLFFPTLLAGPIERFRDFAPTYAVPSTGSQDILPALHRIATGYIKKFVLADNLAVFGIGAILDPSTTPVGQLWFAALIQLLLIFLDFSGYCDIAIGIGSLMGIKVRENFAKPFRSINIQEFWERWHISMSSLMRDYVFTPVAKQIYMHAPRDMHWTLITVTYFAVMILIALWHNVSTGFLLFGILHGAVLITIQLRAARRGRSTAAIADGERVAWMVATYLFVSFTMVLWMRPGSTWINYYAAMFRGLLP